MKVKSDALIWLSVATAVISAIDSMFKADILNLAGTQWMLVAIVLGVWGIYVKSKAKA